MRQILTTIVFVILSSTQFSWCASSSKQSAPAVEMVSYEQTWLDSKGTIALKNNTTEEITNVSFTLEYLDMKGNPMDYETFSYDIDIAPEKTRKLDIPAYESKRNYHYYKSTDGLGHPSFKLKYELNGYNLPSDEVKNGISRNTNNADVILFMLFIFGAIIGAYALVAAMATKRNRNPVAWTLLSIFVTPFTICFLLLIIGKKS